ncbi:Ig-like domain-containing protein [Psychrobium sp. nBUS_13]|uniref:Ig-like domain-containing protein n=1 Tax=Psychrobium sp. nBUS_13 TaxID=3395319 RepID=UPI003EBDFE5B
MGEGTVTVNPITSDDIINLAESGVTPTAVTGTVTGELSAGDAITFTVNGTDYSGTVNSDNTSWSVDVATADLLADLDFTVTATGTDVAGNPISATVLSEHTVDTDKPDAPTNAPDLVVASDTGSSSTDDITNINTPTFTVNFDKTDVVVGDMVKLYNAAGAEIGSKTLDGADVLAGKVNVTVSTALTSDGTHNITAGITDIAGNESDKSTGIDVTIDTIGEGTVTVNPITPDDIINLAESGVTPTAVTGTVTGELSAGDAITFTVNGTDYSGTVNSDNTSWSVDVATADLLADLDFTVTATGTDVAGNPISATVLSEHTVDTDKPDAPTNAPDLVVASDTGSSSTDDITNINTPTFTVNFDKTDVVVGDMVKLYNAAGAEIGSKTLDGADVLAGKVNVTVSTALTSDGTHNITAGITDIAGNESDKSTGIDVTIDTIGEGTVTVNPITSDDIINLAESGVTPTAVTGTVTGELSAGDAITFTVNGTDYSGTVNSDNTSWSVDVATADLLADLDFTVTATGTDVAGNPISATVLSEHTVDTDKPDAPTNAPDLVVASDTGSSSTDDITNINTPTFTVNFDKTDVVVGDMVKLYNAAGAEIGSKTLDGADVLAGKVNVTVSTALTSDGTHNITAGITDIAGNESDKSTGIDVTIDTIGEGTVTVNPITSDDIINLAESGVTPTAVTGTVTGELSAGDAITFTVNGTDYSGTVNSDNTSWSVDVATADLLADLDFTVTATGTDVAGNPISATVLSEHTVDTDKPDAPTNAPDLVVASDTGSSSTDDITNINTPTFTVNFDKTDVVVGDMVKLYNAAGAEIGSKTLDGADVLAGKVNVTVSTALTSDGTHNITAGITDIAGNESDKSTGIDVTIDTIGEGTVTVNPITSDDIINLAESGVTPTAVTGTVTGELSAGDAITFTVNGTDYSGTVNSDNTSWSVDVATTDLLADLDFTVTATGTDVAGNPISATVLSEHTVENQAPTDIILKDSNGDELTLSSEIMSGAPAMLIPPGIADQADFSEEGTIIKTGDRKWNMFVYSDVNILAGDGMTVSFSGRTGSDGYWGFNKLATFSARPDDRDFGFNIDGNKLYVSENEVNKFTSDFNLSDVLSINIDKDTGEVTYLKNSHVIYTSKVTADLDSVYKFFGGMFETGSGINSLNLESSMASKSKYTIFENEDADTFVAALDTIDPDSSSWTYELVGGDGATDNEHFKIGGSNNNELILKNNTSSQEDYSVRVKVTDNHGKEYEEVIEFKVGINQAPTDIIFRDSDGKEIISSEIISGAPTITGTGTFSDVDISKEGQIIKTGPNSWKTVVFSEESILASDGMTVSFSSERGENGYWGFDLANASNNYEPYIRDFGFYISASKVYVTESTADGKSYTTKYPFDYKPSDVLSINIDKDTGEVTYLKNNHIMHISKVTADLNSEYKFVGGSYLTGSGINSLNLENSMASSKYTIFENEDADTFVTSLGTIDKDSTSWTYELVGGDGATDNAAVKIGGTNNNELILLKNTSTQEDYSARVKVTDNHGKEYEEVIEFKVGIYQAPTDIIFRDSDGNEIISSEIISGAPTIKGTLSDVDISKEGQIIKTGSASWNTVVFSEESILASDGMTASFSTEHGHNGYWGFNLANASNNYGPYIRDFGFYIEDSKVYVTESTADGKSYNNKYPIDFTPYDVLSIHIDQDTGVVTYLKNNVRFYVSLDFADLDSEYKFVGGSYLNGTGIHSLNLESSMASKSKYTIFENEDADTFVAALDTTDPDSSSWTYELVGGDGATDNEHVKIGGSNNNELILKNNTSSQEDYSVRVKVTDDQGKEYEEVIEFKAVTSSSSTPLILDLDGDGVETLSVQEGVKFDIDADGDKDTTGWVGEDDGLLVRDINNDGIINDGSELFGEETLKNDGTKANDGYDALRDLDSNNDGVLNSDDDAYNELQVWQDRNSDGITQADEMMSLEDAGVSEISLASTTSSINDNGNIIGEQGSYTGIDGSENEMADVWFTYQELDNDTTTIDGLDDTLQETTLEHENFVFNSEHLGTDTVLNFDPNVDKLDLSELLIGETLETINNYLDFNFTESGTTISISANGDDDVSSTIVLDGVDLSKIYGTVDTSSIISNLIGDNNDGALLISSGSHSSTDIPAQKMDDLDEDIL